MLRWSSRPSCRGRLPPFPDVQLGSGSRDELVPREAALTADGGSFLRGSTGRPRESGAQLVGAAGTCRESRR